MPKLAGLSGPKIVKALKRSKKLTYRGIGKGHALFKVEESGNIISIPMHREVSRYLLKDQLKLAGISVNEFYGLLRKKK